MGGGGGKAIGYAYPAPYTGRPTVYHAAALCTVSRVSAAPSSAPKTFVIRCSTRADLVTTIGVRLVFYWADSGRYDILLHNYMKPVSGPGIHELGQLYIISS